MFVCNLFMYVDKRNLCVHRYITYVHTYIPMHVYINTYTYYISVTGMKFRIRKRQYGLGVSIVTRDFGIDASRCADK